MTAAARLIHWADDRLNPIVVKELRQAVQSRFVVVMLVLFLVVELASMGIFLLASDDITANFNAGREAFMMLQVMLLGTCLLFVPLYVGIRFAGERSDTNVDLLFVTTIRPAAIVRGKLVAGFMVTILIYSACAPFMVITYLLRGLDLPSIFYILGLDLLVVFAAMQIAIFLAATPMSVFLKGVTGVGLLIAMMIAFGTTMGVTGGVLYGGIGAILPLPAWGAVAAVASPFALVGGLLFVLTVAVLTPNSANRMLIVRLYLLVAWLVSGAMLFLLAWSWSSSDPVVLWFMSSVLVLSVMLILSTGEREDWGPRIRRYIPRRWWLRAPAFLVYTGSAGGVLLYGLMLAITFGCFELWLRGQWTKYGSGELAEMRQVMFTLACFAVAYALTAVFLRRSMLGNWFKPLHTPGLTIALVAAACLVPMLTAFLLDPLRWDQHNELWMLPNPFGGLSMTDHPAFLFNQLILAASWAVAVTLLCLPWFVGQWRRFQPLTAQTATSAADAPVSLPPVATIVEEGAGDA